MKSLELAIVGRSSVFADCILGHRNKIKWVVCGSSIICSFIWLFFSCNATVKLSVLGLVSYIVL